MFMQKECWHVPDRPEQTRPSCDTFPVGVLEKKCKRWRQLWEAYAVELKLEKQEKSVQVGTLTLALGPDALDHC